MKYLYLTLNWVFGVLFLLVGIFSLADSPLSGLCLIIISLLLLPPSRSLVYSISNKKMPTKFRVVVVFVLFLAFGFFFEKDQVRIEQELSSQQVLEKSAIAQQENLDYFNENSEQIIDQANASYSEKKYQDVISQTSKYLLSENEQLKNINAAAKSAIAEKQKKDGAVIGRWCDKMIPNNPQYNHIMEIIISKNGEVILKSKYSDGSSISKLQEISGGLYEKIDSDDKFRIVENDGSLQLLDNDGLIRVAYRLESSPKQTECSN